MSKRSTGVAGRGGPHLCEWRIALGQRDSLEGGGASSALQRADELVYAQIATMQRPEDFTRVIAEVEAQIRYPDNAERFPWVIAVWKSGEPRYEPCAPADGPMWPGCSLIDAPTPYGTLGVNARRSNAFSAADIATVQYFARLIGSALQHFADVAQQGRVMLEYMALQEVHLAVQRMEKMEDIVEVMQRIRDGLEALHIDCNAHGINVLDLAAEPPRLHICNTALAADRWTVVDAPAVVEEVASFARGTGPAYRSDLSESDPYGEQSRLSKGDSLVRSVVDIPFSHGTIAVNSLHRHAFSARDIAFMEKMAEKLSQGFWRRDQLQSLRDQRDDLERRVAERTRELSEKTQLLESLHQISLSVLSLPPNLDKLLDDLAEKVLVLGLFRNLMIALVDWERDEVRVMRSFSRWDSKRGRMLDKIELVPHRLGITYSLDDENITAVTARSGQLQVVEEWDDRLDSRVDTPSDRQGQMAYFIPIMHGGRSVAVLATASLVAAKEATLRRIEQMQPLLDQVAMALVQTRLFAETTSNNEVLQQEVVRRQRGEEELRASESKWRLLSANIPDFVAVIDAEGRVLSANRPLLIDGQEKACESVCHCIGLGNGSLLKGWIDLVFWTGEQVEFEIPAADDTHGISREFLIAPIDDGSDLARAVFIACDTSEREQRQEQLIRLERLRVQGDLTAGISHNLNNILTGVLLPAQMLKRLLGKERERQEVDDIIQSAQRAGDLVQRLQRSSGQPQVGLLQPVQIKKVVEDAVQTTRPRWRDEAEGQGIDIEIELNVPDDIPPICGEESGLHEMIVNLLLNACDAMPAGGRIGVDCRVAAGKVCVGVSDTGIGMDDETIPHISDPFFTSKNTVGSGLGLSTLRAMVEQWNGHVEVSSVLGEGSTFVLHLPIWRSVETRTDGGDIGMDAMRAIRVLVVDDEEVVRESLRRLFANVERVEIADSGTEALAVFAPGRFDVALIDLAMPGMPGDRLAHELRRLDPHIGLVLMSGLEVPEGDRRRERFDVFLQKPCAVGQIFAGLARAKEAHSGRG